MVQPREEQIGAITVLDEDGYGSVDASDTIIRNVKSFALNEEASVPGGIPDPGTGKVWYRDDGYLVVTDDTGTDRTVGLGGSGGGTLSETLTLGNTTGGTNIVMSSSDLITGSSGTNTLNLENGAGNIEFNVQGDSEFLINGADSAFDATGQFSFIAGTANSSGTGSGTGGGINMVAGSAGGTGDAGDVNLVAGSSSGTSGDGGAAIFAAGNVSATNGTGGIASLTAGNGNGSGFGGNLTLTAGEAGGNAGTFGGQVIIQAGDGGSSGTGNNVSIQGGDTNGFGPGGAVNISGGDHSGSGVGGNVALTAGNSTSSVGGSVFLRHGGGGSGQSYVYVSEQTNGAGRISSLATSGSTDSPDLTLRTGNQNGTASSGNLTIETGTLAGGSGSSGDINISTPSGPNSGGISLTTGSGATGGNISLTTGSSGSGSAIEFTVGVSNDVARFNSATFSSIGNGKVLSWNGSENVYVDLPAAGDETLAETLALGNTTDGYNIEISTGDIITNETDTVGFTIRTKDSGTPGTLTLRGGESNGVGAGGGVYLYTGANTGSGFGGQLLFETGDSSTAGGGSFNINLGDGATRGGNFELTAGNGTSDDGGYIEFNSGHSPTKDGDIRLLAAGGGAFGGASTTGGTIQIEASDGTSAAGFINLISGDSSAGSAGFVNVEGGDGATNGGFINLSAGAGTTKAGYINLIAGNTDSTTLSDSGYVDLTGGTGNSGGRGGPIRLTGGSTTSGIAGNIELTAGDATTGTAGSVTITTGSDNTNYGTLTMQLGGNNTIYSTENLLQFSRLSSGVPTTAFQMDSSETVVNAANGNNIIYSTTSGTPQVQIRRPSGSTVFDSSSTTSIRDQTGVNAFIADNSLTELLVDGSYFVRGNGTELLLRAGTNLVTYATATTTDIRAGAVPAVVFDNNTNFSGASTNDVLVKGSGGYAEWVDVNGLLDGYFSGDVEVAGKLTVGGLIDPTGMVFSEQSVAPYDPSTTGTEGMLWVRDDENLIYTNQSGEDQVVATESADGYFDGYLNNQTSASEMYIATETIHAILEQNTEASINYDLPLEVNGVSPFFENQGVGTIAHASKLICEISVGIIRTDGSSFGGAKYFASWDYTSASSGYSTSTDYFRELTENDASVHLTFGTSTDGGSPAAPRISVGINEASGLLRYFIEIKMTLFKPQGIAENI